MTTALPELPDDDDFRMSLTELARRVLGGAVYHGDKADAVCSAVRHLRADPQLWAALLGGCLDYEYNVRYDTAEQRGKVGSQPNADWGRRENAESRLARVRAHPACSNAELVRRATVWWVGDWGGLPAEPSSNEG